MTHRSHSAQPAVTRPSGRNRLARVVDAAGEETGAITADPAVMSDQIQPASLDLRLGTVAYRLRASFLAGRGNRVTWHSPALSFCMRTEASVLMEKIRLSIFTSSGFQ